MFLEVLSTLLKVSEGLLFCVFWQPLSQKGIAMHNGETSFLWRSIILRITASHILRQTALHILRQTALHILRLTASRVLRLNYFILNSCTYPPFFAECFGDAFAIKFIGKSYCPFLRKNLKLTITWIFFRNNRQRWFWISYPASSVHWHLLF